MNEHPDRETHHGFVMLDIGDDAGALIVYTERDLHGVEIEISPAGMDAARQHVAVLERTINSRSVCAAVFPSLVAGSYSLWRADQRAADRVEIVAGTVSEVDWRS